MIYNKNILSPRDIFDELSKKLDARPPPLLSKMSKIPLEIKKNLRLSVKIALSRAGFYGLVAVKSSLQSKYLSPSYYLSAIETGGGVSN